MTIDLQTMKSASAVAYEKHDLSKYPEGYQLDRDLSNSRETVLFNPTTNQAILAFRGTADKRDILSDVALATGNRWMDSRYSHSKKKAKKFNKKYADSEKGITGHSLAGDLAQYSANQHGLRKTQVTTFNKGSGIALSDIAGTRLKNQTDVRTKQDLVSFTSQLQRGGKKKQVRTKKGSRNAYGGHLLQNMNV
jgi:hypothetical protein